jgi:hypothetical protein
MPGDRQLLRLEAHAASSEGLQRLTIVASNETPGASIVGRIAGQSRTRSASGSAVAAIGDEADHVG